MIDYEQALVRIEALCDSADKVAFQPPGVLSTEYVRAVLADVQPRYWLPAAVDILVESYRAGDMNGVHRTITGIINRDHQAPR